ncbi:DNA methyltransferase [Novosphingobium sp.]|uniref:Eco57I restriction-modification methylase domain-containing protein n=1 Tax=Novosphingobium sp. TaxID=1874826 RepID=UPI00260A1774|nr:DNA methyltransferase [Novosphingobium sp.]
MARRSSSTELGLIALTIEGGLIAPEQVQKIIAADRTPKTADSYACPKGTSLGDEIARFFRIGQAIWRDYDQADAKTIARTAAFARDLLTQCLGFTDLQGPVEHREGTRRYRIAWEGKGGRVPVVVAAPVEGGDAFAKSQPEFGDGEGARPRRSPTALLQDWLNGTDHALWGLVFAGDRVRIMRDNASLTRPAWIEANLADMFRDEMFADFTAFWLLAHATRFGAQDAAPSDCQLEQWREAGLKQGVEARKDLYANVATALEELGQGIVTTNPDLRNQIATGALPMQALFEELLRTVYRLIFLAVAEDRDLLHPRRTPREARHLYAAGYSFTFWRERSRRRVARDSHHDAWEAMKVTLAALEHGEEMIGLPALGGLFAQSSTRHLNTAIIPNRAFLAALFCLGFIRKDGITHRINWRDLKTEELGSVYEGLLEIRPSLTASGDFQLGTGAKGNDRKTSGSYYTPDSLVECLLDSALNPVLERVEASGASPEEKVAAILNLKVIDPACGSGHFLLGAARRMADRVARLRNEDAGKEETQAALRDVVSRCIHGVDRNPMAVELAKVALWIESVSPGQPLGFLDANIRCGDALLGVFDLAVLEDGIPDEAYKPLTGDSKDAAKFYLKANRDAKKGQGTFDFAGGGGVMPAKPIAAGLGRIKSMPEDTVAQVEKKRQAFEEWKADPARYATEVACDLYIAAFLTPKTQVPASHLRPMVPTTADVRQRLAGGQVYPPLEGAAREIAGAASALHWPLEFPDVMVTKGGFDVVLGNPPWERIKIQEQEFFAGHPVADEPNAAARTRAIARLAEAAEGTTDRTLYESFQIAKRIAEAASVFARVKGDSGGRYRYTGTGDVNTYALFAENFVNLTRESGRAGMIVPTGIATDATTAPFFVHLIRCNRLASLYSAYEVRQWFKGTDDRKSFCLLTIGRAEGDAQFVFAFRAINEIENPNRRFTLNAAQIAQINPNTRTAPIFRSRRDAELTAAIYDRVPVLINEQKGLEGNPWGVSFMTMFHMSNDSGLFHTAAQLEAEGCLRDGTDWVSTTALEEGGGASHSQANGDAAKTAVPSLYLGEKRFVPLYEAKMIHHFDHRWATYNGEISRDMTTAEKQNANAEAVPRYWVPKAEVVSRLAAKNWDRSWLMGWRDISLSSVERTTIGGIVPLVGLGHPFPVYFTKTSIQKAVGLTANLASLSLDFIARQKVGGTHLTYCYLNQFPILPPSAYDKAALGFIVPRVLELTYTSHSMAPFALDLGYEGPPFAWDEDRRAQLRAELDAWYALAYGLTRDELRYVLDPKDVMGEDYPSETFRVLQSNEIKKYGDYRTQRMVLSAYDALVKAAPATQEMADGHWQGSITGEADVRLLLAAILRRMGTPRSLRELIFAFLYAAQPHLLTQHLDPAAAAEWRRLVGSAATTQVTQSVTPLSAAHSTHFGTAQAWLAARRALRYDADTQSVDRGASIYEIPVLSWADGRANFVWHALRSIDLNAVAATLSQEERRFVAQAIAA